MKVIMISGFKDAGKNTTADVVMSHIADMGNTSQEYALASPIKDAVSAIFGFDRNTLEGKTPEARREREVVDDFWDEYIEGLTQRNATTLIGTDILRKELHNDIWVIRCKHEILKCVDDYFVITDLREPNEEHLIEEFCKEQGIETVHINVFRENPYWINEAVRACEDNDDESLNALQEWNIHTSEWLQAGLTPDYVVYNTVANYSTNIQHQLLEYDIYD